MIWRAIPFFSMYEVSEYGDVRRVVKGRNGRPPAELAGSIFNNGYRYFGLMSDEGPQVMLGAHRLVALSFIGDQPTPDHEVAHWDGNPQNNHYSNLRWATPEENAADRKRHGHDLIGEDKLNAKLCEAAVLRIFELAAIGFQQRDIADLFDVHQSTIWNVLSRHNWSHVAIPDHLAYDAKRFCPNGHDRRGRARCPECTAERQRRYRRNLRARQGAA